MNAQAYQVAQPRERVPARRPNLSLHVNPLTKRQIAAARRSRLRYMVALFFVTVVLTLAIAQAVQLSALQQRTQMAAQEISRMADVQSERLPTAKV
ncbi:MAG: hypothetical protein ACK5LX_15530 [Oscillospiraceae bacterium]